MRDVQANGSFQVVEFLAESQRQPRELFHKRADGKIESLNMAGADCPEVPYALNADPCGPTQIRWRVPTDFGIHVVFNEHAVANRLTERLVNLWRVAIPAIS